MVTRVGWVLPLYRRCSISVSRLRSRTSDRVPFGSGAYSYFRLVILTIVIAVDFRSPDHPGLAPHPPIAGRVQNRSSRFDSAADAGQHCPGALDGSLRNPPQPVGSLMAEHQVGSACRAGRLTIITVASHH